MKRNKLQFTGPVKAIIVALALVSYCCFRHAASGPGQYTAAQPLKSPTPLP